MRMSVISSTSFIFLKFSEERSLFNSIRSFPPISWVSAIFAYFSDFSESSSSRLFFSIFCVFENFSLEFLNCGLPTRFSASSKSYLAALSMVALVIVYSPIPKEISILSLFSCIISKGLKVFISKPNSSFDSFWRGCIFKLSIIKFWTSDLLNLFPLCIDFSISEFVICLGDSR